MIQLRQRTTTALAVGVLLILLAGIALAVVQPGGLGDDDGTEDGDATSLGPTTTVPADATTTTAPPDDGGTGEQPVDGLLPGDADETGDPAGPDGVATPGAGEDGGGQGGGGQAPGEGARSGGDTAGGSPADGSGFAAEGAGSVGDVLADTGGPSWMIVAGGALVLAAAGARRLGGRSSGA